MDDDGRGGRSAVWDVFHTPYPGHMQRLPTGTDATTEPGHMRIQDTCRTRAIPILSAYNFQSKQRKILNLIFINRSI